MREHITKVVLADVRRDPPGAAGAKLFRSLAVPATAAHSRRSRRHVSAGSLHRLARSRGSIPGRFAKPTDQNRPGIPIPAPPDPWRRCWVVVTKPTRAGDWGQLYGGGFEKRIEFIYGCHATATFDNEGCLNAASLARHRAHRHVRRRTVPAQANGHSGRRSPAFPEDVSQLRGRDAPFRDVRAV